MPQIELVIKIPEVAHDLLSGKINTASIDLYSILIQAVQLGTPLPKGHGRLIDADELYNSLEFPNQQFAKAFKDILNDAPTIIEADKESEDV